MCRRSLSATIGWSDGRKAGQHLAIARHSDLYYSSISTTATIVLCVVSRINTAMETTDTGQDFKVQNATSQPLVQALLRRTLGTGWSVNVNVHQDDQMYRCGLHHEGDAGKALFRYFQEGMLISGVARQIVNWRFDGFKNVRSFLDFAAGYGRSTRFLIGEIPPERVWVSDILEDAVLFQSREFGVHPILYLSPTWKC